MAKSSLLSLAIALAVFGTAVMVGHPPWGAVTGIAILLTALAVAVGALTASSEDYTIEPRATRQRIPNSLATLSATAILAVYAAGYYRTRPAEDKFEAQEARRNAAAPAVAEVVVPKPALPAVPVPPALPRSAVPQRKTADAQRPSDAVPSAPTAPRSDEVPSATLSAASLPPAVAPEAVAPDAVRPETKYYKDGTYLSWGFCRHGSIQASVVIQDGQIASAEIAQCQTRYSCSWIFNLPGQVVTRQSTNVDYVTGATESTDAFHDAVSNALAIAHE